MILVLILLFHFNLFVYCHVFEEAVSESTSTTDLLPIEEPTDLDYMKMKKTLQEGYMMVFLMELTRLMATKPQQEVHDVVKHTDQIIRSFYKKGELLWFGEPLIFVTKNVAKLLQNSDMDVVQDYAAQMHNMITKRKVELTSNANKVLERADVLFSDEEGELLFDVLKEFAMYPKISLSGYWLCDSLINNFLRPFRRIGDTKQRQKLMNSINKELRKRFTPSDSNERDTKSTNDEASNESDSSAQIELVKKLITTKQFVTSEPPIAHKEFVSQKELHTSEELFTSKEFVTHKKAITSKVPYKETVTQREVVIPIEVIVQKGDAIEKELATSKKVISQKEFATQKRLIISKENINSEEVVEQKEFKQNAEKFASKEKKKRRRDRKRSHRQSKLKALYDIFRAYDSDFEMSDDEDSKTNE